MNVELALCLMGGSRRQAHILRQVAIRALKEYPVREGPSEGVGVLLLQRVVGGELPDEMTLNRDLNK